MGCNDQLCMYTLSYEKSKSTSISYVLYELEYHTYSNSYNTYDTGVFQTLNKGEGRSSFHGIKLSMNAYKAPFTRAHK